MIPDRASRKHITEPGDPIQLIADLRRGMGEPERECDGPDGISGGSGAR